MRPTFLDFPQGVQHMKRGYISNGTLAQDGKNVVLQTPDDVVGINGRPLLDVSFMPFAGNGERDVWIDPEGEAFLQAVSVRGMRACFL